jgi:hypothetical protein
MTQTQTRKPDAFAIPAELQRGKPNGQADLLAELARLREENAALKAGKVRAITMKVGKAGGVSLYGMGRYPTTLFGSQWLKVLDLADEIRAFIEEHRSELSWKE